MNFKSYIKYCEEPLPGLGLLVRSQRDPRINQSYYEITKNQRNTHCFNYQLNTRCNTYKKYKQECYRIKQIFRMLCNVLPSDVVNIICSIYVLPKKSFSHTITNYLYIRRKNEYKWYIMVSNILYTMKEKYHPFVLNLTKGANYNYMDTFGHLMKGIGSQRIIQENGICLDLKGDNIFEIAQAYRTYLNNRLYPMYINMLL